MNAVEPRVRGHDTPRLRKSLRNEKRHEVDLTKGCTCLVVSPLKDGLDWAELTSISNNDIDAEALILHIVAYKVLDRGTDSPSLQSVDVPAGDVARQEGILAKGFERLR